MNEIKISIPKIEITILIRHDDRKFAKTRVFILFQNKNQIEISIMTNVRNSNSYSWDKNFQVVS